MLQVPFGMKMGAKVSVGSYIVHSMIPVFIGNTIAGAMPTHSPDNLLLTSECTDLSLSQTIACAQHCKNLPHPESSEHILAKQVACEHLQPQMSCQAASAALLTRSSCHAAMFFVAMSYAFMYGTLAPRLANCFWSVKDGHLPTWNDPHVRPPGMLF